MIRNVKPRERGLWNNKIFIKKKEISGFFFLLFILDKQYFYSILEVFIFIEKLSNIMPHVRRELDIVLT
jgi:hypothetical protein